MNLFEICFWEGWICISKHAQRTKDIALQCMAARLSDEQNNVNNADIYRTAMLTLLQPGNSVTFVPQLEA